MEKYSRAKFADFIQNILKRPGMFNVSKVEDVYYIIFGYQHCIYNYGIEGDFDLDLSSFRQGVNSHFSSKQDFDWVKLIRFYSGNDKHTLELFSTLFDKYWPAR